MAIDERIGMCTALSLVIFDLDGTLIDSAANILTGLRATFDSLDMPVPDDAELSHYIGPPVRQSFLTRAGLEPARAEEAGRLYGLISDEHFREGVVVYPGILDALDALAERGALLAIATSKPEHQALVLLGEHGLRDRFETVVGYTPSGQRESKAGIIREVIDRIAASSGAPSRIVMIGDREHDIAGAHANGIESVWAGWGYGVAEEGAKASRTAPEPHLLDHVLGELLGSPDVGSRSTVGRLTT